MKWLGQYIQSFTARFRGDVYLESLGTSSETNTLVVDSDGKITKNTSISGDITGVTITTDSGGGSAASDTAGSADFSILGSTGVGVTNSGTTITAVAVPGEIDHDSLGGFVAAEHYDWSTDISSTATVHANNINDLHGAGVDGSVTQLLTDVGNGTINSESYFAFRNSSDISVLYIKSNEDANDQCTISTTTNGATTITTTDDNAAAAHFEIAADGDITLDAAGNIVNESDQINFNSPNANDPLILIKNTADDATSGRLRFLNQRGADGQDNDETGVIEFYSYDDGTPSGEEYATIKGTIHDATAGQESGRLQLQVASHDGGTEDGIVLTGGSVDAEVDVIIGNGTASRTTVSGNLTISGDTLNFASHIGRRAVFPFQGWGTADGTNYEAPEILATDHAPFEHNTSYGSDGLTAQEPRQFIKSGSIVMPHNGKLINWTGWAASAGSGTIDMSLFKATLTRDSTTNVTPVLLKNTQFDALGNTKLEDFAEDSFSVTFSAGDVIYTAVKGSTDNKLWYLDSTLEVEWT